MKNFLSLLVLIVFLFTGAQFAQIKTAVIPDLEGKIPPVTKSVSTELAQSRFAADPGFPAFPGFPIAHQYTYLTPKTGGIYCNLDQDSEMEIVYGAGENLYAINLDGTSLPGFPKTYAQYYEVVWAPSFGDIDGDGEGEIVAGIGGVLGGKIYAYHKDGTDVTGFPITSGKYIMTPVLANLDGDGAKEIILGNRAGQVHVYKGDGSIMTGWPKTMNKYIASDCAAGDIDHNGVMDVVAESGNLLYAWDKDGQLLNGFPHPVLDSAVNSNSYSSPLLVDLNHDNKLEIVFCAHGDSGGITDVVNFQGQSLPGWPKTVANWIYGAPIVADVNNDGNLDVIVGEYGASETPAFYVYAYNLDGSLIRTFGPNNGSANQLTIADVDNDGELEIVIDENITVDDIGKYTAYNFDGSIVTGWPLEMPLNTSFGQPLLGDLNGNGTLDMTGTSFTYDTGTRTTYLAAWNTTYPYDSTKVINPMYQFDATHNGLYLNPPVPVELTSFTASVKDGSILLNWQTATEINNKGFEVEKTSSDGNWTSLGFVKGSGTTTEKHFYSFEDKNVTTGKYKYSLKQMDFDGSFKYSSVAEVNFGVASSFALSQNYPNPFNPSTTISFTLPVKSMTILKVYDMLGKEVATLINRELPEGNHSVKLDASSFNSGVYVYRLESGSYSQSRKMILMK